MNDTLRVFSKPESLSTCFSISCICKIMSGARRWEDKPFEKLVLIVLSLDDNCTMIISKTNSGVSEAVPAC